MGCAAAWALAERGAEVTIYEQFDAEHTRGSSHGRTRIFRLAYPEPHWVELAQEALAGWRELGQRAGRGAARAARARRALLERRGVVERRARGARHRAPPARRGRAARARRRAAGGLGRALAAGRWRRARGRGATRVPRHCAAPVGDAAPRRVARRHRRRRRRRHRRRLDHEARPRVPVRVTRETVAYFAHDGPPMPSVVELDEETRNHAMYALHDPQYGMKAGAHQGDTRRTPTSRSRPTRRSSIGSAGGCGDVSRTSTRSRWPRSPASTRPPQTSRSCSNGVAGSSSARPARATASSSRRPSGGGSPS